MVDKKTLAKYQTDIGIECHVQLKTKSKLFSQADNNAREAEPNTKVTAIDFGLPGTLPVLNREAIKLAIRAGLALNCKIAKETKFDRKNYFYPDLPKGYQISQYDQPINYNGEVTVPSEEGDFKVRILRAHLEEDAGKTLHFSDYSLVDLNRAGTPLLEIVSEPDIHSPTQAKAYIQEVYNIMCYAKVSDVDLYHGNMRFDVNVSVRKKEAKLLGIRSETKNLNSFKSVERACAFEIERQIEILEKGGKVVQETRGWDETKGKTYSQRTKEEAHDYRYFPEPDVPPLLITDQLIKEAGKDLIGPASIRQKLIQLGLTKHDVVALLTRVAYIDTVIKFSETLPKSQVVRIAHWIKNDIAKIADKSGKEPLLDNRLAELARLVEEDKLSNTVARSLLPKIIDTKTELSKLTAGMLQVSDELKLGIIIDQVVDKQSKAVEDYKKGNQNSIQFLVGQVMKQSKGQANPKMVKDLLQRKLNR